MSSEPFRLNDEQRCWLDAMRRDLAELEGAGWRGLRRMRLISAIRRLSDDVIASAEAYRAECPHGWVESDDGIAFSICLEMWRIVARGESGNPPPFDLLAALDAAPTDFE